MRSGEYWNIQAVASTRLASWVIDLWGFSKRTFSQTKIFHHLSFQPSLSWLFWHHRWELLHSCLHQKLPCPFRIGLDLPQTWFSRQYTLWNHHMWLYCRWNFLRKFALLYHPRSRWWEIRGRSHSKTPKTVPNQVNPYLHDQTLKTRFWIADLEVGRSCSL